MLSFPDYTGRQIRLTQERIAHICEHPELVELESDIALVLLAPDRVIQSRTDSQVRLYYRFQPDSPVGGKWLCVVVKLVMDDAFVVTAYLTDKPKLGVVLWPSP